MTKKYLDIQGVEVLQKNIRESNKCGGKMETTKISMNVPNEVLERVKNLAEKADMEYTRLIVNMIDETSKTMDACGKVGLLQFSMLMRNMSEKMSEWAESIKKKKIDLP